MRNALATAADWSSRRTTTCNSLEIHLNDNNVQNVARGLLISYLVDTIDPESQEDLEFLWGVWYCLRLKACWHQRLQEAVRHISTPQGAGALNLLSQRVPQQDQAAQVAEVLRVWEGACKVGGARAVPGLEAERREHLRKWFGMQWKETIETDTQLDKAFEAQISSLIMSTVAFSAADTSTLMECGGVLDVREYYRCGSVYPHPTARCDDWVAIPTLVHPETGEWQAALQLGDAARAHADLRQLTGSDDPLVEQLRQQVAQAMSL